jgi:tRNA threonylcarbamoyladenosine biosynthesis protein TsaB
MKLLALETSTDICSIAFIDEGKTISLVEEIIPRKHAEQLPVYFQKLNEINEHFIQDISAIAVSIGPGSFTGLRIGLSYAKGLAFSRNLPIIPVPTLMSLVEGRSGVQSSIRVLLYSHGDTYFEQKFVAGVTAEFKTSEISVRSWNESIDYIGLEDIIIEWGCSDYLSKLNLENKIISMQPSARWIGRLANKYYKNWMIDEPYSLVPTYVSPFKLDQ